MTRPGIVIAVRDRCGTKHSAHIRGDDKGDKKTEGIGWRVVKYESLTTPYRRKVEHQCWFEKDENVISINIKYSSIGMSKW